MPLLTNISVLLNFVRACTVVGGVKKKKKRTKLWFIIDTLPACIHYNC